MDLCMNTHTHFEELEESTEDDDMNQLLDYFEDNYIGRRRRRNRANPVLFLKFGMYTIVFRMNYLAVLTTALKVGIEKCKLPLLLTIQTFGVF